MKPICISILLLVLIISCNRPAGDAGNEDQAFMEGVDTTPVVDMHTSRIALDYHGKYRGILPCGDCDGIETTIMLLKDDRFEKTLKYLGRDKENVFRSVGHFSWEPDGGVIRLEGDHGYTRFMVAENFLVHMEDDGARFSGDLGDHYVLQKILE